MIKTSPADDTKDILINNGSTYVFGTNLFVGYIPPSPDECVSILDSGGFTPDVNSTFERPTIQIRLRALPASYVQALSRFNTLLEILHGKRYSINDNEYTFVKQGGVAYIGRDDSDRNEFVCEILVNRVYKPS